MAGIMNKPHRNVPKYECTTPGTPNSPSKTFRYDEIQRGGPGHALVIGADYCPACPNCRKILRVYGANNESKKTLGEILRAIGWEQITRSIWLCDGCKDDEYARQTIGDGSAMSDPRRSMAAMYGMGPMPPPGYPPPGYPLPPGYPQQPGAPPATPQGYGPGYPQQPALAPQSQPAPPLQQHAPPQIQAGQPPVQPSARPAPQPQQQGAPKGTAYHASLHAPPRPHAPPVPAQAYAATPEHEPHRPTDPAPPPHHTEPPQHAQPVYVQAPPQPAFVQPPPPAYAPQPPPQPIPPPRRQRVAVADWRARSGPPPQLSAQPYTPYAAPYAEPNGHPQADYARAMAIANGNPGAPQTALSPAPSAAPLPQGPTEADTAQAPPTPQ